MTDLLPLIVAKYNYWLYVILMMIGLYAMIAKNNLIKKLVGMNIFQTAIILFYVSIGYKRNATIPIIQNAHGGHDTH
nr:cation:proton antiporter subunit C [Candidatus Desulfobacula maris]